jgi:hypothetical protein
MPGIQMRCIAASAALRRTGQPFCGDRRPAAGLFLPGGIGTSLTFSLY